MCPILIYWASQIACGMNFLSSKMVLHLDLAARNVLLCNDNVVKLCDFGLARDIYLSGIYAKKSKPPMPFKLLAIESLEQTIFNIYSDVWSFGNIFKYLNLLR